MKKLMLLCLVIFFENQVRADCLVQPDGKEVSVTIESCENISPATNDLISQKAGPKLDSQNLDKLYTGALVVDQEKRQWVYPSKQPDPCSNFKTGSTVIKNGYYTCCDTGSWGKCVFGGRFLGDKGGEKINAFQ